VTSLASAPAYLQLAQAMSPAYPGSPEIVRRFLREGRSLALPPESDRARHLAVATSHPRWLVERWLDELGPDDASALLASDNDPAPTTLRVITARGSREHLIAALADVQVAARPTQYAADGLILESAADPIALPGWREGWFTVQGEASSEGAVNYEIRVLVGSAYGLTSPVRPASPTLYVNLNFPAGTSAETRIAAAAEERALYSTDEGFELDGVAQPAQTMVVLEPGTEPLLAAPRGAHIVMIGGAPLGHRYMVWNFVSSSKERIVQAQDDWEARRFPLVPGDEVEFIPLPPRK